MTIDSQTRPTPAGFEVDRSSHTIRFERRFCAQPVRVFEAWTSPEQVTEWWDAMGQPLASCEIDLRPGGRFVFATCHHPDKPFAGVYTEITPPARLGFEANGAQGRVNLEAVSGGTRMTVEIVCLSDQHLKQFLEYGIADGTNRTLNNLVSYLER